MKACCSDDPCGWKVYAGAVAIIRRDAVAKDLADQTCTL